MFQNWINLYGLTYPILLNRQDGEPWYSYGAGYIPHNAIINLTSGDPNYSQYQLLYTASGYTGGYTLLRTIIDRIQGSSSPPPTPTK